MLAKLLHLARSLQQPGPAGTAHQCWAVRLVPLLIDIHIEAETGIVGAQLGMCAHADSIANRIGIGRVGPPDGESEGVVLKHLQRCDVAAAPVACRSFELVRMDRLEGLDGRCDLTGPAARLFLQPREQRIDLVVPQLAARLELPFGMPAVGHAGRVVGIAILAAISLPAWPDRDMPDERRRSKRRGRSLMSLCNDCLVLR
jgi:hypothetical protein